MAYDTNTAKFIARGDHGHPMSDASWWLYRTPNGAFFEVYYGHDGAPEEVNPFTDQQARRFLEKTANHLVEEYFGPMPEASPPLPMRFSRHTIIAAVEVLEGKLRTHDAVIRYLRKLDLNLPARCEGPYLSVRFTKLMKLIDEEPEWRLENGERLWERVVEDAAALLPSTEPDFLGEMPYINPTAQPLLRALERDAFTVSGGTLRRTLPVDLGLPTTQSEVDRLLEKHAFTVPKGHLNQAIDAHAQGHWASANGQFRPFLEGLLDDISARLAPAGSKPLRGLSAIGFLSRDLNERDFIDGLIKRLHSEGPHPGLSGEEDSTFRFHVVLLTARLLLSRFDTWGQS